LRPNAPSPRGHFARSKETRSPVRKCARCDVSNAGRVSRMTVLLWHRPKVLVLPAPLEPGMPKTSPA
jgi:hypothetical protein